MPNVAKNCFPWYSNRSTSAGLRVGARWYDWSRFQGARRAVAAGRDTFRREAAQRYDDMSDSTDPRPEPKSSVAKVAVIATLGVLLAGALIAGGITWSLHRYGDKP